MEEILNLQPERVLYYFTEICKIPHGSGNMKKISDYCVDFAKKQGLKYIQDKDYNVIIFKDAQNTDSNKTVMIQGHLDMVCEKVADLDFDFEKAPLKLKHEGDWLSADGTSLGGDDGTAIAYALAVLEDKNIVHPNIEAIFTVDEEIGLLGAQSIDLSQTKGNILLNIDGEKEGLFTVSCAGGARVNCRYPLEYTLSEGIKYIVTIEGLKGGHSGVEIDKYRANSNILAIRLLNKLCKKYGVKLISLHGGSKDNAITSYTKIEVFVDDDISEDIRIYENEVKNEFRIADPGLTVTVASEKCCAEAVDEKLTRKVINLLLSQPNGVQNMELAIPGLVRTSLNMGILNTDSETLSFSYAVRSSLRSEKATLIEKIQALMELAGGEITVTGDYSPWEYRAESPLRESVTKVYEKLYGKAPVYEAIHAGLECGVLGEKIANLDAISFGPDIPDIHSPEERLSISSLKRVWDFIVELLEELSY